MISCEQIPIFVKWIKLSSWARVLNHQELTPHNMMTGSEELIIKAWLRCESSSSGLSYHPALEAFADAPPLSRNRCYCIIYLVPETLVHLVPGSIRPLGVHNSHAKGSDLSIFRWIVTPSINKVTRPADPHKSGIHGTSLSIPNISWRQPRSEHSRSACC